MGKDLRTTPVEMKLHRYPNVDTSAWGLRNAQPYFPPLERLFKTETISSFSEYGVRLSNELTSVIDKDTIRCAKGKMPIHRKTTMILNPFKWMRGDYGELALPKPTETAEDIQKTLQSPHTAGYVGAMASIALSESGCAHFPTVYGVYTGIAEKHTIDLSDDYEDLSDRRWFGDNIGKTFDLKLRTENETVDFRHTRTQRPSVFLGEDVELLECQDVDADHVSQPSDHTPSMTRSSQSILSKGDDDSSSNQSSDVFDIRSCACHSTDDEEEEEDYEEDDEPFAWATFSNVPVITTVMEKCEGTFYELMAKYPQDYEKYVAWMSQIVFALGFAQRSYGFVHNDLHGNNVMYVPTTQEYLYYKVNGVCYRLPTYGYLMKIIDFDRCIVSLRLHGMKEPRQFVSSQFQPDEEAGGQYNMEPFFDPKHPHIPPSSSFDLARLATSLFWDIFPDGPSEHPLNMTLQQWMQQSDGSSVMFRRQKDNHDRYHGFDLYKAIARYCKSAVPRREILRLIHFQVPSIPVGANCLFLEN